MPIHTHMHTNTHSLYLFHAAYILTCERFRLLSMAIGMRNGIILLARASLVMPSLLPSNATLWIPRNRQSQILGHRTPRFHRQLKTKNTNITLTPLPLKTECGCLHGVVTENGRTRKPMDCTSTCTCMGANTG